MRVHYISTILSAFLVGALMVSPLRAETTIHAVVEADLPTLDPLVSTGAVPRYHGHMIYETLFGMDSKLVAHPVMVDEWSVSDDGLVYSFTLRDGLKWHDGKDVTAEDVIASLKRWAAVDKTFGGMLADRDATYQATGDKSLEIKVSKPMPMMIDGLAKSVSPVPFIMPKRIAETDPTTPITDPTGSGPFIFNKDAWVPGTKIVYDRNPDYVPRSEPADGLAGARIVKVDHVEWLVINDAQAVSTALRAGEVDFWENPRPEMMPLLKSTPGLKATVVSPAGIQGILRLNHLQPPFDNPKAREAMYWLVNQREMLDAYVLDPKDGIVCGALFGCGTVWETDVASEPLVTSDPEKAKQLMMESGWDFSQPIEFMHVTTIPSLDSASLVFAQAMRNIGLTVNLEPMDWATLTERRGNKGKPEDGGWNLFMTEGDTLAMSNPITMPLHSAACDAAWFGWPCDEKTETLRTAFANTSDLEERKKLIKELQERSYTVAHTYIPRGQYTNPVIHSDKLVGLIEAPFAIVWWGVEKK